MAADRHVVFEDDLLRADLQLEVLHLAVDGVSQCSHSSDEPWQWIGLL